MRHGAAKLTGDFGKGLDERSLRFVCQFYLAFPIWNALRTELSWTRCRELARTANGNARRLGKAPMKPAAPVTRILCINVAPIIEGGFAKMRCQACCT